MTPSDAGPTTLLGLLTLFHVHGLVASTLATLATGGTVVVPGKFSPLSFWRVAREHAVTWYVNGSPTTSVRSRFASRTRIPRTATGKIQRRIVAQAYAQKAS